MKTSLFKLLFGKLEIPGAKSSGSGAEGGGEDIRYRPLEWPLIRQLFGQLRPYRWFFAGGLVTGIIGEGLNLLGPQFIRTLINFVTSFRDHAGSADPDSSSMTSSSLILRIASSLAGWAGYTHADTRQSSAIAIVVAIIVMMAAVITCTLIARRFTILIMAGAGENVQFSIRKKIFTQLQRLSMSYYDKTQLGRIISRCTSDVNSLREVNVWAIHNVVIWTLQLSIAVIMLWLTDWRLFVSVAWLGPIIYFLNERFRRRLGSAWQITREGFTRVSTNLAENITGAREVIAFNRQEPNLSTFNSLQEINTDNNLVAGKINGAYNVLLLAFSYAGKVIILTYGAYLIATRPPSAAGAITIGAVVQAFLYWDFFMGPIVAFGNFSNVLMQAMAGAERVFALLELQPQVKDLPDASPLPRIEGRVTFDHVTFGYDPQRPILHDINFEVQPGQTMALVGHTGSGKSSIISLISRFYQPQQGRILVDGHDIRQVQGATLNRQTGLVLQVNYLFTGSVMDNIRYGKTDASPEDVIRAAHELGTYDTIMSLQDGFETEVGERGANMSLGQRQLICFTRAYLADSRIFMLDEATSSVDTATELIVQHSLEKLLQGRTTFIVAHRLSTIMRADQILVIDHGHIVERGTHQQLVAAGGTYAGLYERFVKQSA